MRLPDLRLLAVAAAAIGALAAGGSPALAQATATPSTTAPCAAADLALREVSATAGALPQAVYALHNRGAAACRISGRIGIRLFDAQGKPIAVRIGPNSAMPMLLTLAPGDEGTFTVTYGRFGTEQCTPSARIEVYFAPQLVPVSSQTSFVACAVPALRISNLRLGPAPAPSAVPSPPPSISPPTSRAFSP